MRKQTTMTAFVVVPSRVVCATNNQGPVGCCFDYRQDGLGTTRVRGWLSTAFENFLESPIQFPPDISSLLHVQAYTSMPRRKVFLNSHFILILI